MRSDGDLIAHHLDAGIPWVEALAEAPFGEPLMMEWAYRRGMIGSDQQVYVAITPIDITRSELAPYHGPDGVQPLPEPWHAYAFDHPDVKAAYWHYARRVIDYFEPDFLTIGIEVNGLLTNTPESWQGYLDLHRHVYTRLKAEHPDLPVMASVVGMDLLDGATDTVDHTAQISVLADILPYSDYFALSLYPYMSSYTTDILPDDLFERLRTLSDKPMAIAETGYPAESFTLTLAGGPYTFASNPAKQAAYMEMLLDAAHRYDFRFVVNFILRDYDRIWAVSPDDETLVIWRDTGIYDADGRLRPAGEIWLNWLKRPLAPSGRN
jgi:hypothetical protein